MHPIVELEHSSSSAVCRGLIALLRQHRQYDRSLNQIDLDWPQAKPLTQRLAEYVGLDIKASNGNPAVLQAIAAAALRYKEYGGSKPDHIRFQQFTSALVDALAVTSSQYLVIGNNEQSWRPQNGTPLTEWLIENSGGKLTKALRKPNEDDVARTRAALLSYVAPIMPKRLRGDLNVVG